MNYIIISLFKKLNSTVREIHLTYWTIPWEPRKLCVQYCFKMSHTFIVLSVEPEKDVLLLAQDLKTLSTTFSCSRSLEGLSLRHYHK